MLLCRWCKKRIADAGNPQTIYSNCSDCQYNDKKNQSKNKERKESK